MLSKKATSKAKEELGVLAATILCIRQGCEGDGPEVVIGSASFKLVVGQPKERRGQLSLLELTGGRPQRAEAKPSQSKRREERPRQEAPQQRPQPKPASEGAAQQPRPEPKPREAPKPPAQQGPPPAAEPPRQTAAQRPDAVSIDDLAEAAAQHLSVDVGRARQLLSAALGYLASYPSVGLLRFIEDVSRLAKADPDSIKKLLNVLRSAEVVELHELGVVNLKKRIEVKRETKL
ncbi:MAG: hypothetical protein TU35_007100 [Thermoproteus sp. AZ2]|jgi:hypothetical protein|uniref:Uncharacterized protein n=1 Tax=Thermoproteus sp. AZ2 TaxID=1609232 RepID=A0ACC6V1Q7_9CREN|nr:MAG: hypothetical protein TU35_02440 [Thermoproteus sp. AZ2]